MDARGAGARRVRAGILGLRITVAVAALLLAGGLVLRFSVLVNADSQAAQRALPQQVLSILADEPGSPLFDRTIMSPGDTAAACVRVMLSGAAAAGPVRLHLANVTARTPLAEALRLTVEVGDRTGRGPNAAGRSCEGFVPAATLMSGTVAELAHRHLDTASGVSAGDPAEDLGDTSAPASGIAWYRVTAALPADSDQVVSGSSVDRVDLVWTVESVTSPPVWIDVARDYALVLAEDTVLPLLLMSVAALLFLGIQNRIDRRDPKLAAAPLVADTVPFVEAAEVTDPREPTLTAGPG